MRRVAPSLRIREDIDPLLGGELDREINIAVELMQLGARYLAQQAVEQERADFLGRVATLAAPPASRGLRNGYEPARCAPGRARSRWRSRRSATRKRRSCRGSWSSTSSWHRFGAAVKVLSVPTSAVDPEQPRGGSP